jgi:hypothetical protein
METDYKVDAYSIPYVLRFVCMRGMHVSIPVRMYIPITVKSTNRTQIKTKCKMLMLFLNQNFMFFPMVHFFLM